MNTDALWTAAGLAILGIATYMVVTRVVMPRFGSPWLGRRRREQALERAQELLALSTLDDDTRFRLHRCVNTLRARGAHRESWGERFSERDVVAEIDQIWDEIKSKEDSPENGGRY